MVFFKHQHCPAKQHAREEDAKFFQLSISSSHVSFLENMYLSTIQIQISLWIEKKTRITIPNVKHLPGRYSFPKSRRRELGTPRGNSTSRGAESPQECPTVPLHPTFPQQVQYIVCHNNSLCLICQPWAAWNPGRHTWPGSWWGRCS